MKSFRRRRLGLVVSIIIALISWAGFQLIDGAPINPESQIEHSEELTAMYSRASKNLDELDVKGRAPKTGYERLHFGGGWESIGDCDMRNIVLNRDMREVRIDDSCRVLRGILSDPYSGKDIRFVRGPSSSSDVQIDHIVALSDAWQKGAQQLSYERRVAFANDPLNLLAVDGAANQEKSDSDAATWLPPFKPFRCQYVARQIAVKKSYQLWVTPAEKTAMQRVLSSCPQV